MSDQVDLSVAALVADLRREVAALRRMERYVGAYGCAFLARNSATDANVTGDGTAATVDFDTEIFDLGGDFAGDTFTAPATGIYPLKANVWLDDVGAAHTKGWIELVTSNRVYYGTACNPYAMMEVTGARVALQVAGDCDMDAADTAYIRVTVYNGTRVVDVYGSANVITFFCGHRIA